VSDLFNFGDAAKLLGFWADPRDDTCHWQG